MKILVIATFAFLAALAGCKEDKGLHTGSVIQDCAAIAPNQREEAARSIKGMGREDSKRVLAAKYGVSPEAAEQCLK